MEPDEAMITQDLHGLSVKQLRELAIKYNIDQKLKKAQLIDELCRTRELTVCKKTDNQEHIFSGRVTRSRASRMPLTEMNKGLDENLNSKLDDSNICSLKNDNPPITSDISQVNKTKKRGRKKKNVIELNINTALKVIDVDVADRQNKEELEQVQKESSPNCISSQDESVLATIQNYSTFVLDDKDIKNPEESSILTAKTESPKDTSKLTDPSVLPPVRSSTFVLDDKEPVQNCSSSQELSVHALVRSSTFILDDKDLSVKKTATKNTPTPKSQSNNSTKKSIGARILSTSKKLEGINSSRKQNQGFSVKKTITKNNATPSSLYKSKFGVTKKPPNFKEIHKKLFQNMESLSDNVKRKMERSKALMQNPAPRCSPSFQSPKLELLRNNEKQNKTVRKSSSFQSPKLESLRNNENQTKAVRKSSSFQSPKLGLLRNNENQTNTVRKYSSSFQSPNLGEKKTGSTIKAGTFKRSQIPVRNKSVSPKSYGLNKIRPNKESAVIVAGMKRPPTDIKKKKEEERSTIQGVRLNKRFQLQMMMRQKNAS